jgi:predicted CoA-binding protein
MKTLIIGASPNSKRFSYKAVQMLKQYGHEVIPLGLRKGKIDDIDIQTERKQFESIHTISLYIGIKNQTDYYDYILSIKPTRIIFNPGTENMELINLAQKEGIETVTDCTLMMLSRAYY